MAKIKWKHEEKKKLRARSNQAQVFSFHFISVFEHLLPATFGYCCVVVVVVVTTFFRLLGSLPLSLSLSHFVYPSDPLSLPEKKLIYKIRSSSSSFYIDIHLYTNFFCIRKEDTTWWEGAERERDIESPRLPPQQQQHLILDKWITHTHTQNKLKTNRNKGDKPCRSISSLIVPSKCRAKHGAKTEVLRRWLLVVWIIEGKLEIFLKKRVVGCR